MNIIYIFIIISQYIWENWISNKISLYCVNRYRFIHKLIHYCVVIKMLLPMMHLDWFPPASAWHHFFVTNIQSDWWNNSINTLSSVISTSHACSCFNLFNTSPHLAWHKLITSWQAHDFSQLVSPPDRVTVPRLLAEYRRWNKESVIAVCLHYNRSHIKLMEIKLQFQLTSVERVCLLRQTRSKEMLQQDTSLLYKWDFQSEAGAHEAWSHLSSPCLLCLAFLCDSTIC